MTRGQSPAQALHGQLSQLCLPQAFDTALLWGSSIGRQQLQRILAVISCLAQTTLARDVRPVHSAHSLKEQPWILVCNCEEFAGRHGSSQEECLPRHGELDFLSDRKRPTHRLLYCRTAAYNPHSVNSMAHPVRESPDVNNSIVLLGFASSPSS